MTLVQKFEQIIFEKNENIFDSLPTNERILFGLFKKMFEFDENDCLPNDNESFKETQLTELLQIIRNIQNE